MTIGNCRKKLFHPTTVPIEDSALLAELRLEEVTGPRVTRNTEREKSKAQEIIPI